MSSASGGGPSHGSAPGSRVSVRRVSLRRGAPLVAAAALSGAALIGPAVASASAASPAWSGGWLRLAHFSPGAPAVDVYLYPFGGAKAAMVLKNVSYGNASPYESVAPGQYTVAMRKAGAASSVAPVISSTVRIDKGHAYTVAGLGPGSALELRTLSDELSAPRDQSGVRIIQASLSQPSVSVRLSAREPSQIRFPTTTAYRNVPAGATSVRLSAGTASTTRTVQLAGRSTHTLVLLSSAGSTPKLLDLTDSAGPNSQPHGGVEAGLGGDHAPAAAASTSGGGSARSVAGWGAALLVGAGAAAFAVRRLRRS